MNKQEQFDPSLAILHDKDQFEPFVAGSTTPLNQAFAQNKIRGNTPLLLINHDDNHIALSMEQMAYHHVAQGEIGGKPWMVSF
jgi:hypothetical protein